jgi:3-hydroxybutyrate dehydrogenase
MAAGLKGRCALITGSTQGMGWATARALASQGCNVMLHGLAPADKAESLRASLTDEFKVKAAFCGTELADPQKNEEMVAQAERELGPIDILVNNAAIRTGKKLEEVTLERWNYAIAVNLSAPFQLIKRTIPGMKDRKWGRIVNIASNLGLTGGVNRTDYVSTKHGLVGLTRAVAMEALPYRVTVNAICPGATLTPHAEHQLQEIMAKSSQPRDEVIGDFLKAKQPSRRFVLPEQIADLVVFLCSEAASEMTGTPISMDGGWMATS